MFHVSFHSTNMMYLYISNEYISGQDLGFCYDVVSGTDSKLIPVDHDIVAVTEVTVDMLTQGGWVAHICILKAIIDSDNGLVPNRHQPIIWTNIG